MSHYSLHNTPRHQKFTDSCEFRPSTPPERTLSPLSSMRNTLAGLKDDIQYFVGLHNAIHGKCQEYQGIADARREEALDPSTYNIAMKIGNGTGVDRPESPSNSFSHSCESSSASISSSEHDVRRGCSPVPTISTHQLYNHRGCDDSIHERSRKHSPASLTGSTAASVDEFSDTDGSEAPDTSRAASPSLQAGENPLASEVMHLFAVMEEKLDAMLRIRISFSLDRDEEDMLLGYSDVMRIWHEAGVALAMIGKGYDSRYRGYYIEDPRGDLTASQERFRQNAAAYALLVLTTQLVGRRGDDLIYLYPLDVVLGQCCHAYDPRVCIVLKGELAAVMKELIHRLTGLADSSTQLAAQDSDNEVEDKIKDVEHQDQEQTEKPSWQKTVQLAQDPPQKPKAEIKNQEASNNIPSPSPIIDDTRVSLEVYEGDGIVPVERWVDFVLDFTYTMHNLRQEEAMECMANGIEPGSREEYLKKWMEVWIEGQRMLVEGESESEDERQGDEIFENSEMSEFSVNGS